MRDIYVTRMVNGAWTEGRPVHADGWVMPACPVNGPQADADGQRVAVAWFTAADSTPAVKLAYSTDGGATFAAPVRVDGGNPEGRVDVQLLADGGALVSWIERTGETEAAVRVRRVGAGRADGRAADARRQHLRAVHGISAHGPCGRRPRLRVDGARQAVHAARGAHAPGRPSLNRGNLT